SRSPRKSEIQVMTVVLLRGVAIGHSNLHMKKPARGGRVGSTLCRGLGKQLGCPSASNDAARYRPRRRVLHYAGFYGSIQNFGTGSRRYDITVGQECEEDRTKCLPECLFGHLHSPLTTGGTKASCHNLNTIYSMA